MEATILIYSVALLAAIYLLYRAARNHQMVVWYRWMVEMRIEQRKMAKIRRKEEQKRKLDEAKQAIEKQRLEQTTGAKKSFSTPGAPTAAGPQASPPPAATPPKK